MFKCQECGRKFKTEKAASRAANNGCPKCGGVDIDLDVETKENIRKEIAALNSQRNYNETMWIIEVYNKSAPLRMTRALWGSSK